MKSPSSGWSAIAPALAAVLCLLTLTPAGAQQTPADAADRIDRRLGHELEQVVRPLLQQVEEAEAEQRARTVAADLMDRALRLDPQNAERMRLRIELADQGGDTDAVGKWLRAYIARRGDDDTAQLRLVDLLAERKQTVDGRLAFYRKLIDGDAAARFSSALRSRVAHRAARLAFERGDERSYRRHLRRAMELDQTNRAAARSVYRFVLDRAEATAADRAAALFTLLVADPTDAGVHAAVGDMMLRHGAYREAQRWYEQAASLANASGRAISPVLTQKAVLAMWGQGATDEALSVLASVLGPLPSEPDAPAAEDAAGSDPASGTDTAPNTEPEADATAFPAPDAEAMPQPSDEGNGNGGAAGGGNAETGEDAVSPMLADLLWLDLMIRAAADEALDPAVTRLKQTLGDQWSDGWRADQAWAYLLAGRSPNAVTAPLGESGDEAPPLSRVVRQAARAMGAQTQQGLEALAGLADEQVEATLARGLVYAHIDNPDAAVQALSAVAREQPASVPGLLARTLLRRLDHAPPRIDSAGAVTPVFDDVPMDLSLLAERPAQFVQLRIEPVKLTHQWPEPIHLDLVLRNVSPMPLTLGADGSINAQVALRVEPRVGNRRGGALPPMIVDMNRRLRLQPDQTLTVRVRLDSHPVNDLLKQHAHRMVEMDVTAILNPQLDRRGRLQPGLLGVTAHQRNVIYQPPAIDEQNLDAWLRRLDGASGGNGAAEDADPAGALLTLPPFAVAVQQRDSALSDRIVQTLAEHVQTWSEHHRALVVAMLPATDAARRIMKPVLDPIRASGQPLPMIVHVARLVNATDDPALQAALDTEHETLNAVGRLRQRLIERMERQRAESEAEPNADSTDNAAANGNNDDGS